MITQFQLCGGGGWRLYDAAFRQHISLMEASHQQNYQRVYSTTILSYGVKGQFCQRCVQSNHTHEECALHPNRAVPVICIKESVGTGGGEEARLPRSQDLKRPYRGACFAWNNGRCTAPFCRFNHVWSWCSSPDHKRLLFHARLGEPELKREKTARIPVPSVGSDSAKAPREYQTCPLVLSCYPVAANLPCGYMPVAAVPAPSLHPRQISV